jgi:hypothetical protein
MSRYFKFPAESDLGIGTQYIEFDEEDWPIRQAECYGERWFNSNKRYHQELGGMGLCDQKLSEAGMRLGSPIDAQEFELVWKLSSDALNNLNRQTFAEDLLNPLPPIDRPMQMPSSTSS